MRRPNWPQGSLGRWLGLTRDARWRAALAAVAFVVVACGLAPGTAAPGVTLVIWVDTPSVGASLNQRIVPFEEANPNIQIKVFDQFQKIQNGDVSQAIEALAQSELSPDIVALTDQDFRLMTNRDDLLSLGPYILQESDFHPNDFFPGTLDAFSYQGKQYAIPSEVVPWVIYYNKRLFQNAQVGFPDLNWTDSQFVTDGKLVQQASEGGKVQNVGFVTDPTQAIIPFVETYGVIPQDGVDDPYANWLTDKQTIAAVQWFADLGLHQSIMPVDQTNRELGFWFGGRAAMAGMFMDQRNQLPPYMLRNLNLSLTPTVVGSPTPPPGWKFPWGVTMVPKAVQQTTMYYVSGYGIPQTSHDPDDAWLLIQYLTSHLPDQPFNAYVPARESLAYSATFARLFPETGREAYTESILIGHREPAWPTNVRPSINDLQDILDGTVHPSVGLQAWRDRVEPILTAPPQPTPTTIGE